MAVQTLTDAGMGKNPLEQKLNGFLELKYDEHHVTRVVKDKRSTNIPSTEQQK